MDGAGGSLCPKQIDPGTKYRILSGGGGVLWRTSLGLFLLSKHIRPPRILKPAQLGIVVFIECIWNSVDCCLNSHVCDY